MKKKYEHAYRNITPKVRRLRTNKRDLTYVDVEPANQDQEYLRYGMTRRFFIVGLIGYLI